MELYTSLVRLKQAMNGGTLAPMMAIPISSQDIIDPSLTIGLGALFEDLEKGLRCPVRGCGKYFHALRRHLNATHAKIGGARAVLRALSIPYTAVLESTQLNEKKRENGLRRPHVVPDHRQANTLVARRRRAASLRERGASVAVRNLRNSCEEQLRHRLIDLEHQIRRAPTREEAASLRAPGFVRAVERCFGTWRNALAQCGLESVPRPHWRRMAREAILDALHAYHKSHSSLPTYRQACAPTRTPLIPSPPAILRALGTKSWPEAMQRAAAILNIYGGRYGLPERKASA